MSYKDKQIRTLPDWNTHLHPAGQGDPLVQKVKHTRAACACPPPATCFRLVRGTFSKEGFNFMVVNFGTMNITHHTDDTPQ
ncbi:hypothetical protein CK934_24380 [Chitinophaga sp. MD30]|nr:hypothetical protein CK934_24380 [Chitinophaga sp. MD30]